MIQVRRAGVKDADTLVRLAHDSARESGTPTALDADRLKAHAFGSNALVECFLAEERPGPPVGHAITSRGYDLRRAAATIVVGDLYVRPEARHQGVARLLIGAIARRAVELGSREIMITTGADNAAALRFFSSIGALEAQAVVFVMTGDSIDWLASESR